MLNAAGFYPDTLLHNDHEPQLNYLRAGRPRPNSVHLSLNTYGLVVQYLNKVSRRCMRTFRVACQSAASTHNQTGIGLMHENADAMGSDVPSTYATEYYKAFCSGQRYRCARIEQEDDEVVSSVVAVSTIQGKLFGKIDHFLMVNYDNKTHELAFVNWIGYGQKVNQTEMYEVAQQTVRGVNNIVSFQELSHPLLHAWEGTTLWIPCCF